MAFDFGLSWSDLGQTLPRDGWQIPGERRICNCRATSIRYRGHRCFRGWSCASLKIGGLLSRMSFAAITSHFLRIVEARGRG